MTGFFGSNSAGKSSLLHFLLLLKQTRHATDRSIVLDFGGPADMVNLGTFEDVVHQHDKTKATSWLLDWTLPETLTIEDPLQPSADPLLAGPSLRIRYAVGLHNKRPWPRELAYRFADAEFALVARAVVLNATDSDCSEQRALLNRLRVQVRQLCPQHASKAARRGR